MFLTIASRLLQLCRTNQNKQMIAIASALDLNEGNALATVPHRYLAVLGIIAMDDIWTDIKQSMPV